MLSQSNIQPVVDALLKHPRVYAVVVANTEGFAISFESKDDDFTLENAEGLAALFSSLLGKTEIAVKEVGRGEINFININVTRGEILIAKEEEYVIIAVRSPKVES